MFIKQVVVFVFFLVLLSPAFADVDPVVISTLNEEPTASVIVQLRDPSSVVRAENDLEIAALRGREQQKVISSLADEFDLKDQYSIINGFSGDVTSEGLLILLDDPRVVSVESDARLSLFLQDAVPLLNGTLAHNISLGSSFLTGSGQSVCLIDSGINASLSAFSGRVLNQQCFCAVSDYGGGGCCPNLAATDSSALDDDTSSALGHGTRVASIVAANATVTGIAPGASLVVIKTFDRDRSALVSDTISAIDYCVANRSLFNVAAISMSFGTSLLYSSACDSTSAYTAAVNAAVAANVTPVAATGNAGSTTGISEPACVTNITSVSSTTKTFGMSAFSNRNGITDLVAPGSSITSLQRQGTTSSSSGTSYSAPLVAGAVVLLQQYKTFERGNPLSPAEIQNVLVSTAVNIIDGSSVFKQIDLFAALLSLDEQAPILSVTLPESNAFYISNTSLSLQYGASDPFLDSAWYHFVNASNTTLNGNISLSLPEGDYALRVYANDSAGNVATVLRSFTVNLTSAPVVTLESPAQDALFSVTNVSLNCSARDDGLSNLSLLHNASGSSVINQTLNASGTFISSLFTLPFADGSYLWSCAAMDNLSQTGYAPANRTFTVDTTGPAVNLTSPSSGSTDIDGILTLSYMVTDALQSVSSCSLYLNSAFDQRTFAPAESTTLSFAKSLVDGSYSWFVSCNDTLNHFANSSASTFTVAVPASDSGNSGNAGGGGGGGGGGDDDSDEDSSSDEDSEGDVETSSRSNSRTERTEERASLLAGTSESPAYAALAAFYGDAFLENTDQYRLLSSGLSGLRTYTTTEDEAIVTYFFQYTGSVDLSNVIIYDVVPKAYATDASGITVDVSDARGRYRVLVSDPEYALYFPRLIVGERYSFAYRTPLRPDHSKDVLSLFPVPIFIVSDVSLTQASIWETYGNLWPIFLVFIVLIILGVVFLKYGASFSDDTSGFFVETSWLQSLREKLFGRKRRGGRDLDSLR